MTTFSSPIAASRSRVELAAILAADPATPVEALPVVADNLARTLQGL